MLLTSVFFFPVKIKSARESYFRPFFDFFHGRKSAFHAHFFKNFHGQSKVFTDAFLDFFTDGFSFSREENSEILIIFTEENFFSRVQKKVNFAKFHGKSKLYFSRTHVPIFTYVIWKKFSRTLLVFHGQFLGYFHGRKIFFTDGNPKIDKNFHGRHFDFHGKKKTLVQGDRKAQVNRRS